MNYTIEDKIMPFIIFTIIITLFIKEAAHSSIQEIISSITEFTATYLSILASVMVLSIIIILVIKFIDLIHASQHFEIGNNWIKDRSTGTYIGAIQLLGSLEINTSDRDFLIKMASLQERVESLFEALRNSKMNFCYVLSPLSSLALGDKNLYVALFVVYGRTPEEIEDHIRYLSSACSTTFPELRIKTLKGVELLELIDYLIIPRKTLNAREKLTLGPGAPQPLLIGGLRGLMKSHYGGIETRLASTIPGSEEGLPLGKVIADNRELMEFNLKVSDLRQHLAIFGTTGSGKTTTAETLALRLLEKGIGVLILDWHNEYCDMAHAIKGKVILPGAGSHGINPLALEEEAHLVEHIDFITDMLAEIFELSHPQAFMLREALKRVYLKTMGSKIPPSFSDLCKEVEQIPIRSGWDHETKMALIRRLKLLTEGQIGKALGAKEVIKIEDIMSNKLVVVGLGHLRSIYVKKLVIYTILKMIYDYYLRKGNFENKLKHVIVIEEARNVLPRAKINVGLHSVAERVLSELRKYGEGVIIVTQSPSTISEEVLRNTSTRIVHSLKDMDDIRVIIRSMGLSKEHSVLISKLKVGEALVDTPSLETPLIVRIVPHKLLRSINRPKAEEIEIEVS